MEQIDKIYYTRIIIGIIAGIIIGAVISPKATQTESIGITAVLAIIFYFISDIVAKKMGATDTMRKKVFSNGTIPFVFILLMFMIITFTGLHQSLAN